MPIVKAFFWWVFYYLEVYFDLLSFKFEVPPLVWASSWIGTIALMMDDRAMRSLGIAMGQARFRHMKPYTFEEVFGDIDECD